MKTTQGVSLFNVTCGIVTELFEATAATVGELGSRAVRNWLCTPRPVLHIGQQAVFAFTVPGQEPDSEIRYGIFESDDGESLELTSSMLGDRGWCPVTTIEIRGTEGMIGMALKRLKSLQDAIVDAKSKAALGLLIEAIDKRLQPLPAAA